MQKPVIRIVRLALSIALLVGLAACGDLLGNTEPAPHVIGPISVEGFIALAHGDDPSVERTMDYNDAVVGIKADGSEHVIRDGDIFRGYFLEAGRTFLLSSSEDFYGCGTVEVIEGQVADCFDVTFGGIHDFRILADGSFVYAGYDIPLERVWGQVFENQIRRLYPDGSFEILFSGDDWANHVTMNDGTVVATKREDEESRVLYASSETGPSEIFTSPDLRPVLLGNWDGDKLYLRHENSQGTIWTFDMKRLELDPVPYLGSGSEHPEVLHDLDELHEYSLHLSSAWPVARDNLVMMEQSSWEDGEHRLTLSQIHPKPILYEPELEAVTAWTTHGEHVYLAGRTDTGTLEVLRAAADSGDFNKVLQAEGTVTALAVAANGQLLLVAHTNPAGAGGLLTIMDLQSGELNTTATESPLGNMQAY